MTKHVPSYTLQCLPPFADGEPVLYPPPVPPEDDFQAMEWAGLIAAKLPGYQVILLRDGQPVSLAAN
jgi:hypothetical protein